MYCWPLHIHTTDYDFYVKLQHIYQYITTTMKYSRNLWPLVAFSIYYSSTQTSCISCSVTVGDRPDAFGEPVHHAQHQQRDVGHLGTFYSKMLENVPSPLFRIKEGYVLRNVPTKRFQICYLFSFFPFFIFCYFIFLLMNALIYVDMDQDINLGEKLQKMKTKNIGFHIPNLFIPN